MTSKSMTSKENMEMSYFQMQTLVFILLINFCFIDKKIENKNKNNITVDIASTCIFMHLKPIVDEKKPKSMSRDRDTNTGE